MLTVPRVGSRIIDHFKCLIYNVCNLSRWSEEEGRFADGFKIGDKFAGLHLRAEPFPTNLTVEPSAMISSKWLMISSLTEVSLTALSKGSQRQTVVFLHNIYNICHILHVLYMSFFGGLPLLAELLLKQLIFFGLNDKTNVYCRISELGLFWFTLHILKQTEYSHWVRSNVFIGLCIW